jgi:hypothetical protein
MIIVGNIGSDDMEDKYTMIGFYVILFVAAIPSLLPFVI